MTKVEEVARALCKRCRVVQSCDCGGHLGSLLDDARRAIEAMRVPSEGMVAAAQEHHIHYGDWSSPSFRASWQAMITAALGETDD